MAIAVADQVIDYLLNGTIRNAVNAPMIDGEVLASLSALPDSGGETGVLLAQIIRGAIEEVSIEYIGDASALDTRPLTISVFKGMLTPFPQRYGQLRECARSSLKERNIKVTESLRKEAEDFTNLISVPYENPGRRELGGRDHFRQARSPPGAHQ